jgi:hypothetical protein
MPHQLWTTSQYQWMLDEPSHETTREPEEEGTQEGNGGAEPTLSMPEQETLTTVSLMAK